VPTIPAVPFDPKQAIQLLEEVGWMPGPDGIRLKSGVRAALDFETTSGDKLREQVQLLIRQNLADIGVEVNINNQPAKVFFGLGDASGPPNKGQFDMAMFTNGPDPDPQQYLASWSTDGIPTSANKFAGAYNWSRFSNAEYDSLLTKASQTVDQTQRKALYQRMAEIIESEKPNIFLFNRLQVNAQTLKVQGVAFNPWTDVTWNAADWSISA
jgi:peptide/nickel transport system substrate-binding protein